MYDYFIWNLPLFASRSLIEERLCLTFEKCSIDVFQPRLPKHRTHSGMARVICSKVFEFGEKTPLDLGFRYPAFAKTSYRPAFKLKTKQSHNDASDFFSDEKSDESTFSISICTSIDITHPVIVMNECVNIEPVIESVSLTCENCIAFDVISDLITLAADSDLPTLSISPDAVTCQLAYCFDLESICIESIYNSSSPCQCLTQVDLVSENIESQHSELDETTCEITEIDDYFNIESNMHEIQMKLNDFEQLKLFIKNLRNEIVPYRRDSYVLTVGDLREMMKMTFRRCHTYI